MADRDWCLIHYTDCQNLNRIKETRTLRSALCLMNEAGETNYASEKREHCVLLKNTGTVLRDQKPLTERIQFCDDTTFAEFVEYLNCHVFFWPNNYAGNKARENFRKKYQHSKNIGLRCRLSDLRNANPGKEILFSPYNSGSTPRDPARSPRYIPLFKSLESRDGKRLVEVVARGEIRLPNNTEIECKKDKWRKAFPA